MEQSEAPRHPPGAGSRLFHLPTPAGGARIPGSPRGGGWYCPPPLSSLGTGSHHARFNGEVRRGISHTHAHTPPPPPREWKGPAGHPAALPHPGGPHNGRTSRLAPTFSSASSSFRGLRPPSSPAALPCLLPQDRRPPTRKCPGVTPAAAAKETLPAPPPPAPSHRADPPPPPSWTHNEARRCPTPPRSLLLPPPPSWAGNEASAAPGGPVAGRRGEPSLAEAGACCGSRRDGHPVGLGCLAPGAEQCSRQHPAQASAAGWARGSALRHLAEAGVLWRKRKGGGEQSGPCAPQIYLG